VTEEEIAGAMNGVRSELTERRELNGAQTAIRVDSPAAHPSSAVKVDCKARLHICHAACCKLHFALSVAEIESGKAKWDLGRPYFIRHDSHGCCTHLSPESGKCGIYRDRPEVCKAYSCATDGRIWKNFERMELNEEWIAANLSAAAEPRLLAAFMHDTERRK
jgi:Fe-S-cluster containining protein